MAAEGQEQIFVRTPFVAGQGCFEISKTLSRRASAVASSDLLAFRNED
jgi:hypothetical protein